MNDGQDSNAWKAEWDKLTPEQEIQIWDYYGVRPYILKYTPRNGKVLEAGCGLGRFNFLLSRFGIDIIGLDFSKDTIQFLKQWQVKQGFDINFIEGNVNALPFADNSLSGYLSFGVVEHFIEGPYVPLAEAYRVLRPGGIAIITTPSYSWSVMYRKIKSSAIRVVKKILGRKVKPKVFFQYEFLPFTLKKYVQNSGLKTTYCSGADLMYSFAEFYNFKDKTINNKFVRWFVNRFENTFIKNLGAQSITISVKVADEMHCFLCDSLSANRSSLIKYTVPICNNCESNELSKHYLQNVQPKYASSYKFNPPIINKGEETCNFCKTKFQIDPLFENFGFTVPTCNECLKDKKTNIYLSNSSILPIWRNKKSHEYSSL